MVVFEKLSDYFPLPSPPRAKQVLAMDFIQEAVQAGYRDIVIAAPTGVGKTGVGMAACLWGAANETRGALGKHSGGYYLVTQKMLQDQIEADFDRFPEKFEDTGITLKTSSEYPCASHIDCSLGHTATTEWLERLRTKQIDPPYPPLEPGPGLMPCKCLVKWDEDKKYWKRREDRYLHCPYESHKFLFVARPIGVTNYAYWLSERAFVKAFPIKNILIADECHSIERQLLAFDESEVTARNIVEYARGVDNPCLDNYEDFIKWAQECYLPGVENTFEFLKDSAIELPTNRVLNKKLEAVKNHVNHLLAAIAELKMRPLDWIFVCEKAGEVRFLDEDNNWNTRDGYNYQLKPLNAAPTFKRLIKDSSQVRIYLSAYPGPKDLFCRSLGLDEDQVAWKWLSSTFPVKNRPIFLNLVGSMSKTNYDQTLPRLLSECERILDEHAGEKGLIHCQSYKLGQAIFEHMQTTSHAHRILYPPAAANRAQYFDQHRNMDVPTVMLSPSMTEGFSLDEDLARFQIIAKVPYPYLGDPQVKAKMELDREWYVLQAVQALIQATGRIVRSDTDYGATYILDADFQRLYDENKNHFFPLWWREALIKPKPKEYATRTRTSP